MNSHGANTGALSEVTGCARKRSSAESVGRQTVSVSVTRSMQLLCMDCTSGKFGLGFLRHGESKKNFTDMLRKMAASQ